jgi:DNA-binding CsgD family transcriptional regulator
MCAAELGRVTASSDWASAGSAWRALSWPWPLAYALLRQAEGHLVAERRDAAREPLIESWQLATRLGARPLVAEAERLAGSARVKLGRAADAAEPDGLAAFGLTAREREVLLLVAAGRSNSQIAQTLFISPKTASVHVSNILAKLGLSSRVQAAAVVHRLGVEI